MLLEQDLGWFGLDGPTRAVRGARGGSIRAVAGEELAHLEAHLLRLRPTCRRSRFGCEASDAFLVRYAAQVDHRNTLVLGFFQDGQMRGVAELRSLREQWCSEAEAAFSVENPWQRKGIGTALMFEVVRASPGRCIEHIYLSCHMHNRPMQRIAEKVAAEMRFEDSECFAHIRVRREPAALPVPGSAESIETGIVVVDL